VSAPTAAGTITETAMAFFEACETGRGWEGCSPYCHPDAGFSSQAEPLADIGTLEGYADWMKGLLVIVPDGSYVVKSFATDAERGWPSMVESSPTMAPGPTMARIRSAPEGAIIVTLSRPCSTR